MPKTEAEMPQVQGQPRQLNEILFQNTNIKRAGHRDQGRTTTEHPEDHKFQSKLKRKSSTIEMGGNLWSV